MAELSNGAVRIGWASVDITPDKPVQLHGQMHERVSQHVQDPITATALAIESDAGEQAIMISADVVNVGIAQVRTLRERVAASIAGFDGRKLLVCATHTHTSATMIEDLYPPAGDGVMSPAEYAAFFIDRLADAATRAWNARQPAGMSRAVGHAAVGFNRRLVYRDGSAQMYGRSDREDFLRPEAGEDHAVELLFFRDESDALTGVVVNLACPSQVVEGHSFISADFWHPARIEIRRRLGGELFVLPMCSAAGDQSPRDLVRRNRNEPPMRDIEGANEMGRRIGVAVEDAFGHARTQVTRDLPFAHHTEDLSLPRRKATAAEAETAQRELDKLLANGKPTPQSAQWRFMRRFEQAIERHRTQGDDPRYEADIHVLRLGEVAIATNPFELFLEYGQRIKARSLAQQTLLAQITNDRGIYLPTPRAVAGGHYSAMIYDNIVGPEGGDRLVERQLELINGLFAPAGAETAT